jgi:hypothetical protein
LRNHRDPGALAGCRGKLKEFRRMSKTLETLTAATLVGAIVVVMSTALIQLVA